MRQLFIIWQECNDTGIALIDEQHRGIVSIINTFYYLVGVGKSNNILSMNIVDTIRNYSAIHFTTEEGMLEKCKYKYIEHHRKLHKKLFMEMERIKHEVGNANDSQPLLEFLKKWWLHHINEEDKLYVPHLLADDQACPG